MTLRQFTPRTESTGIPNPITYSTISGILKIRDFFYPPKKIMAEIGISKGMHVLDFGCGIGSYSLPIAEFLQGTGRVYAIDVHPMAIKRVNREIMKRKLKNIETRWSNGKIDLESNSIDVVLLYYVFNDLSNQEEVVHELYRVIKPQGSLSFFEFNRNLSEKFAQSPLFQLKRKNRHTCTFVKI